MSDASPYRASAVERMAPVLDLPDPEPVAARRAVRQMASAAALDADALDDLVGAVSEVVTNAIQHGRPPVLVRGWVRPGQAVVTITDAGVGPDDPMVGARPLDRDPQHGGFGLWLAHQLCTDVAMGRHEDGFTVRLVAGA